MQQFGKKIAVPMAGIAAFLLKPEGWGRADPADREKARPRETSGPGGPYGLGTITRTEYRSRLSGHSRFVASGPLSTRSLLRVSVCPQARGDAGRGVALSRPPEWPVLRAERFEMDGMFRREGTGLANHKI